MKILSTRFRATHLCAALLLALPVTSWAELRLFACFEEAAGTPKIMTADETLTNFFKNNIPNVTGCIEIENIAYSFENVLNIGSSSSGVGAGKVTFNPLTITKKIDKSSPGFFLKLATGTHFQSMNFIFVNINPDGTHPAPLSIQLGLAALSKVESSASGGDNGLHESITFQYGGIKIQSLEFDITTGKPLKIIASAWDRVKNVQDLSPGEAVPTLDLIKLSTGKL